MECPALVLTSGPKRRVKSAMSPEGAYRRGKKNSQEPGGYMFVFACNHGVPGAACDAVGSYREKTAMSSKILRHDKTLGTHGAESFPAGMLASATRLSA